MERPTGVTTIAYIFLFIGAYLCIVGLIMLLWPGAVSMALGAPLLDGLELAGPFMFLLVSAVAALIGWGLLRMNNWARRAALLAAFAGFVMLAPTVSAAVIEVHWSALIWGGLGIIVRMVVIWYLFQTPVSEQFSKPPKVS
jgi:hypothetical protein